MELQEGLAPNQMEIWVTWKSLKRLTTGGGRTKVNLRKQGFHIKTAFCDCREEATSHVYHCTLWCSTCSMEHLMLAAYNALDVGCY